MFPEELRLPLGRVINWGFQQLIEGWGDSLEGAADMVLVVLVRLEWLFREAIPWWLMIALIVGLSFATSRRIRFAAAVGAAMLFIGSLGLWDMAMQTLAVMLVSLVLSVAIGFPVGVALARWGRLRVVVLPILDMMQTLPPFVYLVPVVMLLGLGKVPAIIATVIYAVPPLIRLTDLGLRMVDRNLLEASAAFGATPRRTLFGVQVPLAMPTILAGLNQTTMMALSMVVIASMIGARGLGEQVLLGIQRLDIGKGFEAGLAVVAFAIVLDRITQAISRRRSAAGSGEATTRQG